MNIVFLDHYTLNSDGLSLHALNTVGNVHFYKRTTAERVVERSQGCDVIISNKVKITSVHLDNLPILKLIVVAATGYNNVDIEACRKRGVVVCNVRGYSTDAVVQHTFSLVFALINKVVYYNTQVINGKWKEVGDFSFYDHSIPELSGKVMGIVGYGNIGKKVADVASVLGMKVLANRRSTPNSKNDIHEMVDLERIYSESDIITLHAPLNEESKGMICKKTIDKMKSTAIVINTARGGLIDEYDLADALKNGRIAAAGIDTLPVEPPENSPLFGLNNCLVTPHMAWATVESRTRLLNGIIENIKAFRDGKPINLIT